MLGGYDIDSLYMHVLNVSVGGSVCVHVMRIRMGVVGWWVVGGKWQMCWVLPLYEYAEGINVAVSVLNFISVCLG